MARGTVLQAVDVDWVDLGKHIGGALTKLLITAESSGCKNLDFYISSYMPKACAEEHSHEESEEVFYFISGEGTFVLDGERHRVSAGTVIHVPPTVPHAIYNTGFENLLFVIAASPPEPMWTS